MRMRSANFSIPIAPLKDLKCNFFINTPWNETGSDVLDYSG